VRSRPVAVLVVLALVIAACSPGPTSPAATTSASGAPSASASVQPSSSATAAATSAPPASAAAVELMVFGAASLKGALGQMKTAYEAAVPGTTLTISTDSSSALETQIEQGAPANVFLSADTTNPQKLLNGGFTIGQPVTFAGNRLTVIAPTANLAGVASPADLAKASLKVIAAGDDVPITRYATQLVANLAREPGYPPDFAAKYAANIVSKEDNVKAVVAKIELGEGDAGIVYVTDAQASTKVKAFGVPDTANVPATYAAVVVNPNTHEEASRAFLTWLTGPDGQAILASFGFLPPS
jgi:molybdate transport system substrate-binding protein